MPTWKTRQKLIAIANYKKKTYRELSEKLGKSETAISLFLCSQGVVKCRNYTETETYLLENFPARQCAQFIPHKSLNAIKIKQSRIRAQSHSYASV